MLRVRAGALIVLMVLGSILMWVGLPLGLLYAASTTVDSSTPSMGPYMLVLLWSVATALAAMGVWFLLFGDNSLSLAG